MLLNAFSQRVIVTHALRASDDLAVSFRRQHVYTQRMLGISRVRLHVERLDGCGIPMDHHWLFELRRDVSLIRRAEIATPLEVVLKLAFGVTFLQHLHSIVI